MVVANGNEGGQRGARNVKKRAATDPVWRRASRRRGWSAWSGPPFKDPAAAGRGRPAATGNGRSCGLPGAVLPPGRVVKLGAQITL